LGNHYYGAHRAVHQAFFEKKIREYYLHRHTKEDADREQNRGILKSRRQQSAPFRKHIDKQLKVIEADKPNVSAGGGVDAAFLKRHQQGVKVCPYPKNTKQDERIGDNRKDKQIAF
jgi:hypothetical protein